jgi:uncharacterized protein
VAHRPLARDAVGVGLRPVHYAHVCDHQPAIDYFEVISENYLSAAQPPRRWLAKVSATYPVVLHGVGLNLLGHEPLDIRYLDQLAALAEFVDAPFVSDHLCWTAAHGISHHELLPVPLRPELVEYAAERASFVQRHLGRPFGLENLSSYVRFSQSSLSEWEFYTQTVRRAGCWFMFDINNVYVSSQNHGFSAHDYLAAIDWTRILQVHIAGHTVQPDGSILDTHDAPVADPVWQLYATAWQQGGPFRTLLEWDDNMPTFDVLQAQLARARTMQS